MKNLVIVQLHIIVFWFFGNSLGAQIMGEFVGNSETAVRARSTTGYGLHASSLGGDGVFGYSGTAAGVKGESINSYGVQGISRDSYGIHGESESSWGVFGVGSGGEYEGGGVYGFSLNSYGVRGYSQSKEGVAGTSFSKVGVFGYSNFGIGVEGRGTNFYGVKGYSELDHGVVAISDDDDASDGKIGHGVYALAHTGKGVYGYSLYNNGVYGKSDRSAAVYGYSINGVGSVGYSDHNHGVVGSTGSSVAFDFFAQSTNAAQNYGSASSRRWKTNIQNIPNPIDKIQQLRGVYYDWDAEHGGQHSVGFIAEEVGEILPEIVVYEENGIDAIGMDYSKMTPLLVEALNAVINKYDAMLQIQADQIASLEAQIESMKN